MSWRKKSQERESNDRKQGGAILRGKNEWRKEEDGREGEREPVTLF